jgi:hypothetical protein
MQSFQVAEKDERMEEHRPVTLGLLMKKFRLHNIQLIFYNTKYLCRSHEQVKLSMFEAKSSTYKS